MRTFRTFIHRFMDMAMWYRIEVSPTIQEEWRPDNDYMIEIGSSFSPRHIIE
jgi:hypothetical protein